MTNGPSIAEIAFRGINVTPKTNWCFLEVRTADGLAGIGECTLANQEGLLAAEAARLASEKPSSHTIGSKGASFTARKPCPTARRAASAKPEGERGLAPRLMLA